MSIIYCERHDLRWDSDYKSECPMCEAEPTPEEAAEATVTIYDSAVELVRRERRCDLAFLQKRLGVGEIVAAAALERMERDWIVTTPKADGTREVLT